MDRVVSGARFLTGGVFDCDISYRQSVTVLCLLYTIRCNPMHLLYSFLLGPYVPLRVTRGVLVTHRVLIQFFAAEPRSTSEPLFSSQCPCGTIFLHCIRWYGIGEFQVQGHCFFIGLSCPVPFCLLLIFLFSCFCLQVCIVGLWSLD